MPMAVARQPRARATGGRNQTLTFRVGTRERERVRPQPPYEPGKNGLPSEAGMLIRIQVALREIATSTTIVAT